MTELLLYLHYFDLSKEPEKPIYAGQQIDIIKKIHRQLVTEPHRRFTIDELARQYGMSATLLKTGFKEVYGMPIAAYMKEYRTKKAAKLLRNTSMSIADIAGQMGYASPNKFSEAFKAQMNMNPLSYRKCKTIN